MQLKLVYKISPNESFPMTLPERFELRTYRASDAQNYIDLMKAAGFGYWDNGFVERTVANSFPEGIFFIVEKATGRLAATAMANRLVEGQNEAEFGWFAVHPDFRGCGLGRQVHSAVMRRFQEAKQYDIQLRTDDFRLPALHIYLSLGWKPVMIEPDHPQRWEAIYQALQKKA